MEKTIKELADELGVTKDKVKYQVKKLPTNYLLTKGKITYIKSEGIEQLYKLFGKNYPPITREKLPTLPTNFTHLESIIKVLEDNTKLLQEQLKQKDLQIEQKDKQIENLQEENKRLISALNNTTLSLQASQTLQAKSLQLISTSDAEEQPKEVEKKKSLFSRFKK